MKPDHIFDLERRFQAIAIELNETMQHYSPDHAMAGDLKRRLLRLRDELERLRLEAMETQKLH